MGGSRWLVVALLLGVAAALIASCSNRGHSSDTEGTSTDVRCSAQPSNLDVTLSGLARDASGKRLTGVLRITNRSDGPISLENIGLPLMGDVIPTSGGAVHDRPSIGGSGGPDQPLQPEQVVDLPFVLQAPKEPGEACLRFDLRGLGAIEILVQVT